MAYDDVFKVIGSFGRYQKILYLLQTLPVVFTAIQACLSVFILFAPDHRCNDTSSILEYAHRQQSNQSLPMDIHIHSSIGEGLRYTKCEVMYHYSNSTPGRSAPNNATVYSSECRRWVFDMSEFDNTFVTQENLVCRKKLHRTHATMAFMAGFTVGSLGIGIISDRFGRKPAFLISAALHIVSNTVLTWIIDFWVFSMLRFFSGVSVGGLIGTTYVMDLELVGPSMRMLAGTVYMLFWGLGVLLLALMAYLIRDWRWLNLVLALPTIFFLSYYWFVPESTRWLVVRGKTAKAEKILRGIAIKNNRHCPERILTEDHNEACSKKGVSLSAICSSQIFLFRSFVICLNWLVVACVFSGLSLNVSNLGGDVYLNFLLTSIAEIIGFLLCMPLLDRVGRKPVYIVSLLSGGIALVLTIFPILYGQPGLHWVTVLLSLVGKVGSSAAFATIFLYSAEFFPTIIRNSALGVANFSARVGGMLAPYIVDLGLVVGGDLGRVLPMAVFGISAVVASLLSLILPETLDRRLPETIEDTVGFDRDRKMNFELDVSVSEPLQGQSSDDRGIT
uniref:Organic cation transporter protein-like n=1 Tax=Crassostrea virginica TaxID=6565 RepID=A0A8B8AA66_CRAVI|nr:organic cation transporter protein-like [Crassostrea virginica]